MSVVVPQATRISLRNRIGDSGGDVPYFYLGFVGTMGLILLTCSLFLLVSGLHFTVCSSIDTPLYLFDLWPTFYHCLPCIRRFLAKIRVYTRIFGQKSCIYAGFWPKSAYTLRFLAKSPVHMQLFFIQLHTSSFLVSLMLWEVAGWVVSVVGSSLGLRLFVGCFFCDQRPLFD